MQNLPGSWRLSLRLFPRTLAATGHRKTPRAQHLTDFDRNDLAVPLVSLAHNRDEQRENVDARGPCRAECGSLCRPLFLFLLLSCALVRWFDGPVDAKNCVSRQNLRRRRMDAWPRLDGSARRWPRGGSAGRRITADNPVAGRSSPKQAGIAFGAGGKPVRLSLRDSDFAGYGSSPSS